MQIIAKCPQCDSSLPVEAADAPTVIQCGRCGRALPLDVTDAIKNDRAVDQCPVCAGIDFYVRKDFDPKVGLTVVVIGAAISAVFYWLERDLVAYTILAGAVLLDLVVYGRLKDLTVCYRCHSEFRGSYSRSAKAFDLHVADQLELEYERRIGRR